MADDYSLKASVTADTSKYESGIKKAINATEKFTKKVADNVKQLGEHGLVKSIANLNLAMNGISTTFKMVTGVIQKVGKAVGECTEAYKVQLIAERQLDTAIQNNPFMTGASASALKEFASELQKVSNYGDEQLIPLMANLTSLGRTEEEVMQIMKTATDMASSGMMSLDTAINQLNMTLNGSIGRLGMQNRELKDLSEEELKNGKAVEILGQKYKGLAEATIDTSKQLQNIKGDFKEAIGEFTLPSSDMWNKFWIGFYDKGISVIKQFDDYMDKSIIGKGISEELIKGYKTIQDEREKTLYLEDNIHALSESQIKSLGNYLEGIKNRNKEEQRLLDKVNMEKEARVYLQKLYDDMDKEEAERQKKLDEQKEAESKIVTLKEEYLKKIDEQERKWQNIKNVTGEEVKAEEKIKFYQDSLVNLMTQANGEITTNNQLYKDQVAIIEKLAKEIVPDEEKSYANISTWEDKLLQQQIDRLEQTKKLEVEKGEAGFGVEAYYDKKILELKIQQLTKQRDVELKSVEGTENAEEARNLILRYYAEQERMLRVENASQIKEAEEESVEETEETSEKTVSIWEKAVKKIGKLFEKMGRMIISAIKKIGSTKIDLNTALDNILVFEDNILTFFMETLPKLPSFLLSAIESVSMLIATLMDSIDFSAISEGLKTVLEKVMTEAPAFIAKIKDFLINIIDIIIENTPMFIKALFTIAGELLKALPDVAKELLEEIPAIIQGIVEALPKFLEKDLPMFISGLIAMIPKIITSLTEVTIILIGHLPEIIKSIIAGIINIFKSQDWKKVTTESFSQFGENVKKIWTSIVESCKTAFSTMGKWLKSFWDGLVAVLKAPFNLLIKGVNFLIEGLNKISIKIPDWVPLIGGKGFGVNIPTLKELATGTQSAFKGLTLVGEAGPELVNFRGGEQVLNNRNTNKALENMGGTTVNQSIVFNNLADTTAYAMMKQFKQYNRQMAINGVI